MTREPASGHGWANGLAMGCDRGLVLQAILRAVARRLSRLGVLRGLRFLNPLKDMLWWILS